MKIAQISPIWEKIPPKLYGGTGRIVYLTTEGLVKRGHKVTLFASADSQTSAELIPTAPRGLYDMGVPWTNISFPTFHIATAFDQAEKFDLIHMHLNLASDFLSLPLTERTKTPTIFTFHFRFKNKAEDKLKGTRRLLLKYRHLNFISISNSQRTLPLNFISTVYNAIQIEKFPFKEEPADDYLLWVGRVAEEKGAAEAIEVAKRCNKRLILAGKVDAQDKTLQKYYQEKVKPHIDNKKIKFIGELPRPKLAALYQNAQALIFPLNWDEPFGLVMPEAMACGTPVIAYNRGSVPELVIDGKTGFVVKSLERKAKSQAWDPKLKTVINKTDIEGMVEAVKRIGEIKRADCRRHVEERFSAEKMVEGYEKAYRKITRR